SLEYLRAARSGVRARGGPSRDWSTFALRAPELIRARGGPSRSWRSTLRSAASSLRDAAREHAEDFAVERLAQHLVFVARVDVRIAVDLDEIDAVLDLLQIGAVQAAADQVGGP